MFERYCNCSYLLATGPAWRIHKKKKMSVPLVVAYSFYYHLPITFLQMTSFIPPSLSFKLATNILTDQHSFFKIAKAKTKEKKIEKVIVKEFVLMNVSLTLVASPPLLFQSHEKKPLIGHLFAITIFVANCEPYSILAFTVDLVNVRKLLCVYQWSTFS